jgi:hypothetical protein
LAIDLRAQDSGMTEPGLDLHEWETQWQQAQDDAEEDATGALAEMDRIIAEMLGARGFQLNEPVTEEGEEPEILREYLAAHETKLTVDTGDFDPGDVGAAIEGLQAIYAYLVGDRAAP